MNRREFIGTSAVGMLGIYTGSAFGRSASSMPPNFVFILADDLGWSGLSVQVDDRVPKSKSDFYETPELEKLAAAGICFSDAYAPAPMCTPSRASFFTGKSPAQLHMTTPGPAKRKAESWQKIIPPKHVTDMPESETTIAELLKTKGYISAHLGKWHLHGGGPAEHGFAVHDGDTKNGGSGEYKDPNPKDIVGITDRAISFMKKSVASRKPFYLQLSHYAVHQPYEATRGSRAHFEKLPAGKRHNNVEYAAMTYDLDVSIGRVAEAVRDLGIESSTYIVFMSDNGAGSKPRRRENDPLSGGKASLSEGGIRVPLIVRGPGIEGGTYCHTPVAGYDLFPTFCWLAGIKTDLPKGVEGVSMVPLLAGQANRFAREHDELVFHFPHYGAGPRQKPQSAIRLGNYKLILDYETDRTSLYDLSKEIGEETDLSARLPEKAKELKDQLDANLKRVNAQMPNKNPDYDSRASRPTGRRQRRNRK